MEKKGTKLYSAAPLLALVLQNAAAEYQLPLPAASTIRTALELGAAAGGAVGIRSATSGDREAKRLAAAVEALGGPEQLLGMSMEEVTAHLGEPAECAGKATPSYLYGEYTSGVYGDLSECLHDVEVD